MTERSFTHRTEPNPDPPESTRLPFPGIRARSYETQLAAMEAGYNSTIEWAIDHLAERLIELEQDVDRFSERLDRVCEELGVEVAA